MFKHPRNSTAAAVIIAFALLPGTTGAQGVEDAQDARAEEREHRQRDLSREVVLLREFQLRVDDYLALRSWSWSRELAGGEERSAGEFESESGTPSEFQCLPNLTRPAPVIGREERARPVERFADSSAGDETGIRQDRALFSRELEDLFRETVGRVLPPVDQARVLRVMSLFPAGVPVRIVSEELFRVLPALPEGLEYRFREHDLLVVDLDANRVVDSIWLVIGPAGS